GARTLWVAVLRLVRGPRFPVVALLVAAVESSPGGARGAVAGAGVVSARAGCAVAAVAEVAGAIAGAEAPAARCRAAAIATAGPPEGKADVEGKAETKAASSATTTRGGLLICDQD